MNRDLLTRQDIFSQCEGSTCSWKWLPIALGFCKKRLIIHKNQADQSMSFHVGDQSLINKKLCWRQNPQRPVDNETQTHSG